jgi:hypothetical protein
MLTVNAAWYAYRMHSKPFLYRPCNLFNCENSAARKTDKMYEIGIQLSKTNRFAIFSVKNENAVGQH